MINIVYVQPFSWEDETDTRSGISLLSYFRFWYDIDCLFDVCFDREMSIFDYKLDFIQLKEAKRDERSYPMFQFTPLVKTIESLTQ